MAVVASSLRRPDRRPARLPRRLAVAVARRRSRRSTLLDAAGFVAGRRDGAVGRRRRTPASSSAAAPSSPGAARPAPVRCRCASSAPTPTRRTCASSRAPTPTAPAGASSASRSTAACCSTAGSTATSASPAASSLADGTTTLVAVDEPIARVPQLAIHLDRDVNERGLVLDRQAHLSPVWATDLGTDFASWIAERAGTAVPAAWELGLFDVQPAAVLGADRSLLASGRLDNQVSCWAATTALAAAEPDDHVAMIALFDHEEVGSASTTGASGPFLETVIERLDLAAGGSRRRPPPHAGRVELRVGRQRPRRAPQLPRAPRPRPRPARQPRPGDQAQRQPALRDVGRHRGALPAGVRRRPACRTRCSCRATTCRAARRSGRSPRPASASPPSTSACPQLSMHSARELCGADDPAWLAAALTAYLAG